MSNEDSVMTIGSVETSVAHISAVPPGEGRTFAIGGRRIAIFHTRAGEVYATQADCPHKGGPLADGLVGGNTVICPLHVWKFDLKSGDPIVGSCPIQVYPARLDDQKRILVTLGQLGQSATAIS
jgi:nitrite reductase (NADH) small subunit